MNVKTVSISCPSCGKNVLMTSAFPDRPFCSNRCKSIDFGAWANEEYKVESDSDEVEQWSEEDRY